MRRNTLIIYAVVSLVILALSLAAELHGQTGALAFAVELKATQTVSSEDCISGQAVLFATVKPFSYHGQDFPAGTLALARVTQCKRAGHAGRGGLLEVALQSLQLADGKTFPLAGLAAFRGGSRVTGVAGGALAAGYILTPLAAPAALLLHGKAALMPAGTLLVATLGGSPGSAAKPAPSAKPKAKLKPQ